VLVTVVFEASQTYKLKVMNKYLTIVEAQGDRWRYSKAYLANRLDGSWIGLVDSCEKPFLALVNVVHETFQSHFISHGELPRTSIDERPKVDPTNLRFVFQGASDGEYRGSKYGMIPWRLGLLRAKGPSVQPQGVE
jgi:hypothetical protein